MRARRTTGPRRRTRVVNLNYNHLHYFWVVATLGSIARAARTLHVTPQTISGQIRALEERLGAALFARAGKKLTLTDTGRIVHSYADPMFSLGRELGEVLEQRSPPRPGPLSVGVAAGIEKSIACRILCSALDASVSTRLVCHGARGEVLMAALAAGEIDLAVTDVAVHGAAAGGLRSQLLGQSALTFFAPAALAARLEPAFPAGLNGAPLVTPARDGPVGKALAEWFRRERLAPSIVAEIDDTDLAASLCERHGALLALPTIAARDVERRYGLVALGEAARVVQHFYVVSAESSRRQESILAVVERAREAFRADAAVVRRGALGLDAAPVRRTA